MRIRLGYALALAAAVISGFAAPGTRRLPGPVPST
jgi:hypothetical protein